MIVNVVGQFQFGCIVFRNKIIFSTLITLNFEYKIKFIRKKYPFIIILVFYFESCVDFVTHLVIHHLCAC